MAFDPDAFLADQNQQSQNTGFDPDAFLADKPQVKIDSESTASTGLITFDPDAFLQDRPQPAATDNTFDPDAFLSDRPQPASPARTPIPRPEGMSLDDYGKLYQNRAAEEGDIAGAQEFSRLRASVANSERDAEAASAQEGAIRAPYLVLRGATSGLTMGISEPVFAALENSSGGRVRSENTLEALGEGAGNLLGGVFTGMGLAGGIQNLTTRLGMEGAKQVIATRLLANGIQAGVSSLGAIAAGDIDGKEAAGNVAQSLGAALFGGIAEHAIPAGMRNWLGQVITDFVYDLSTDVGIRDRLKDQTFVNWLVTQELPQMVMSVAFATKDLRDNDFERQRRAIVDEIMSKFRARAASAAPQSRTTPIQPRPSATGPDVETEAAGRMAAAQRVMDRYPIDSAENVNRAVNDLNLRPELDALATELETIKRDLASGDRVAGRVPIKDEHTGGIIGWSSAGAAYPEGMDATTATAVRKYLAGETLNDKQQTALETAVKHSIDKLSHDAGYDIANKEHVEQERLNPGDRVSMDDETFTVHSVDEDGNITLQDGRKVTARPGETLLIDRASHVDADGKPVDPIRAPSNDFDTSDLSIPSHPLREDLGDGAYAEKAPDGRWTVTHPDGTTHQLDLSYAADAALIRELDPETNVTEVKRRAQEAADRLPGTRVHFVENEADMDNVRAKYGTRTKDIRAEDGTIRGFAVTGTNDYYLFPRNMRPDQAEHTVIHEAVGHLGVHAVLGDRVDGVMDGIYRDRGAKSAALKRIADRYGLNLNTIEGQREATDELIAHIAERRHAEPTLWARTVARIKDAFRQMGFEWAQEWTDKDILALIERARARVSRSKTAVLDEAIAGSRKAMTYASGRWPDAERQQKVFEEGKRRVYEAVRNGKTIYETQARQNGQWKTVMYSDNLPEATTADYNRPEVPRETAAKQRLWYSVGQPWYARAIQRGISPAEIFAYDPAISRMISAGADTTPAVSAEHLDASNATRGYTAEQPTEELKWAADNGTGIRYSRSPAATPDPMNRDRETVSPQFIADAQKVLDSNVGPDTPMKVRGTPAVLIKVGATPGPIILTKATLQKSVKPWTEKGGKHGLPLEAVRDAAQQLDDPMMILRSSMRNDSVVAVTSVQLSDGTSIVVAVDLQARLGRRTATRIDSFHERDTAWIHREIKAGRLLYINENRARTWSQSNGLSVTKEETSYGLNGERVLTPEDIVNTTTNPDIRHSLSTEAKQTRKELTDAVKAAHARAPYGRPDLSQVADSKQVRDLVADVDETRNERGEPSPHTFKAWNDSANQKLQKDATGEWLNFKAGKFSFEGVDAGENTILARKLIEQKGLEAFAGGDDDEIAKVGAVIWGYRNTRSNIARALAAGRDFQETPAERNRRWIAETLFYPGAKMDNKLQNMDLGQMQTELKKRSAKVKDIRDKLLAQGIDVGKLDEKTLNDPAAMAEIIRQIQTANAGSGDMAYEYWRNAILSAPPTHIANMMGNAASITWHYTAQKATEAFINAITRNKTGTTFGELPGMYRALWTSQRQAARNALAAFSTEQGSIEGLRLDDKGVAIPGQTGRVIRSPQRLLLAADEYAKTTILQAELYSRAYHDAYNKGWRGQGLERRIRDILADPKSDMMSAAIDEAKRLTFQAEPGAITSWFMQSRSVPGLRWVSRYAMPFISTPSNILKMGIRKTPLGILRMAKQAAQGEYRGNRTALVQDAAEQLLAAAGTFALYSLATDEDENGIPRITGSKPSAGADAGKRQAEERMYPAQSIRLGGRWYSYARIEPLATAITHTIDIMQAIHNRNGEDVGDQLGRAFASMKSLVRDKTYLSALGDIIRATEDESKGLSIAQNFAASWIPNFVRTGTRAFDPYYRSSKLMRRDDRSIPAELAVNTAQAALPVSTWQDAPKMDYWGNPLKKNEGLPYATDILWRMVSPIGIQLERSPENFDRMFFNFNRKAVAKGWKQDWPDMPSNAFEAPGAKGMDRTARMTPDEYSRFLKRRGDFFFEAAAKARWNFDAPKIIDMTIFHRLMDRAGILARAEILKERTMLPPVKAAKLANEALKTRPQPRPEGLPHRPIDNPTSTERPRF